MRHDCGPVQAMSAVTRMMGKDIWQYTAIALTHGKMHPPTLEQTYSAQSSVPALGIAV